MRVDRSTPMLLYTLSSVRLRRLRADRTSHRRIPAHMLFCITRGEGTLLLDRGIVRLEPGQWLYAAPGTRIETTPQAGAIEYYAVTLEEIELAASGRPRPVPAGTPPRTEPLFMTGPLELSRPALGLQQAARLWEEAKAGAGRVQLFYQLQELLWLLLSDGGERQASAAPERGLERSLRYMRQHYDAKLTLEVLSAEAGLTPSSFSRVFKQKTGQTPTEFLTNLRIGRAKELLAAGGRKVKEVAASIGIESEYYFSRMFKNAVGIPPSLFVRRQELRVAVASCFRFEDNLASLGIQPVAAVDLYRYPGMTEAEIARSQSLQWELLRSARPDLILGDYYHQPYEKQLQRIAATVLLPYAPDWRVTQLRLAELTGAEQQARETFNRLAQHTEVAKRRLKERLGDTPVALLQINHKHIRIQGTSHHPVSELLFEELALTPARNVPRQQMRAECDPEQLPLLETDYLFIQKHHAAAGSEDIYRRMCQNPTWSSIPAVQMRRTVWIDNWFILSWTPVGRGRIIEQLFSAVGPL